MALPFTANLLAARCAAARVLRIGGGVMDDVDPSERLILGRRRSSMDALSGMVAFVVEVSSSSITCVSAACILRG